MSSSHVFEPLILRGQQLLPIVQGGMGVGISAHRLAGTVASEGAVGTIASVDLRHHHPDLLARAGTSRDQQLLDEINLTALDREIRAARQIAGTRGLIAVNVMKAVASHPAYVRQACESGADAIVMGAGLPLDLPELVDGHDIALIPILSDSRGIGVVLKKWMKKGRLPDAIVIEHPAHAGGHLGATRAEELLDPRFDVARVLEETFALFDTLGIARRDVPLIVAGGINSHEKVRASLALGAAAVQVGTAFAVTQECDAHPNFKSVLAGATPENIVTFTSAAGLPARAVKTPWLERYLGKESRLKEKARQAAERCTSGLNCLSMCGWRDGLAKFGQFCIDRHLAAALRGEVSRGLFFRGSEPLPFGSAIRPARELIEYLLTGRRPVVA